MIRRGEIGVLRIYDASDTFRELACIHVTWDARRRVFVGEGRPHTPGMLGRSTLTVDVKMSFSKVDVALDESISVVVECALCVDTPPESVVP